MNKNLQKNIESLGVIFPPIQRFFHNLSIEVSKTGEFTIAQFRVLSLLEHFGKMTINDLKEHLNIAQSSASGIVDRLEHIGYVKRGVDKNDKRITLLELTPRAKKMLTEKMSLMDNVYKKILEGLSEKEQKEFITLFEDMLKYIEKIET